MREARRVDRIGIDAQLIPAAASDDRGTVTSAG